MRSALFLLFVITIGCVDERIDQLSKWKFEVFTTFLGHNALKRCKEPRLNIMMSDDEYELVQVAMTSSDLVTDESQVFCLFEIADEFKATDEGLAQILSIFTNYLSLNHSILPVEYKEMAIWKELEKFINKNLAIEITEDLIAIEGKKIADQEAKKKIFILADNLLSYYSQLEIVNICLSGEDLPLIQGLFKSHLTSIRIRGCPFNFEGGFDLSQLTELKYFECSFCYATQIVSILKTISSELIALSIESNGIRLEEAVELVEFLKKQTKIEFLNISNNHLSDSNIPKVIFEMKQLKFLNISNNPIGPAFSFHLSSHPVVLKLSYLDVSNIFYKDFLSLLKFFKNFCKLVNLKELILHNNQIHDYLINLFVSIANLTVLNSLTIDDYFLERKIHSYLPLLQKHNINLKTAPYPRQYLAYSQRVNYTRFRNSMLLNSFKDDVKNADFSNLINLTFDFRKYLSTVCCSEYLMLFKKFKSLESVTVTLVDEFNLIFVRELFKYNTRIVDLTLIFTSTFEWFEVICQIIDGSSVRQLKIEFLDDELPFFNCLVNCLSKYQFVGRINQLELCKFTTKMLIDLLLIGNWNITGLQLSLTSDDDCEITLKVPSVIDLDINFTNSIERLNDLIGIFPNIVSLKLSSRPVLLEGLTVARNKLIKKLTIFNYNPLHLDNLLFEISQLPFLFSLTILADSVDSCNINKVKLFHFPNLSHLHIDGNLLQRFIFDSPWLRKLKCPNGIGWDNNISLRIFTHLQEIKLKFRNQEQFVNFFQTSQLARYRELFECKFHVLERMTKRYKISIPDRIESLTILTIEGIVIDGLYYHANPFPSLRVINGEFFKDTDTCNESESIIEKIFNFFT